MEASISGYGADLTGDDLVPGVQETAVSQAPKLRGLSALGKKWRFPDNLDLQADLVEAAGGSELIARVLQARGISSADEAQAFLDMRLYLPTSPMELPDVDKAVVRITQAIALKENITVFGDYDVDGVTGTSVLLTVLRRLGANVEFYIPNRANEGYGLNLKAVSILASKHRTKLIITCDCGVSNFAEINFAKSLGVDTLVLDHHTMPELLPPAVGVVHPKRLDAAHPLFNLPGVGVAYKVCEALLTDNGYDDEVPQLLDFVTLGMIADMVPLISENRYLVKIGMPVLINSKRPGLRALLDGTTKTESTDLVGFGLAPLINAVGRLADARCAVELMTTDDADQADELARQLRTENTRRQELCERVFAEAERMVSSQCDLSKERAIAIYNKGWHHGVVGIVASRLVEKFHRPVFIGELDEAEGMVKGSARGVDGIDLYQVLKENEHLLTRWGGHQMAAGFSVETTKANALCQALVSTCTRMLIDKPWVATLPIDVVAEPVDVNLSAARNLVQLAPFGMSNRKPVICLRGVRCAASRALGKEGKHTRIMVVAEEKEPFECVMWNSRGNVPGDGAEIDVVFTPEVNSFNGRERLQLVLIDWRPAGMPQADDAPVLPTAAEEKVAARRAERDKMTAAAADRVDPKVAAQVIEVVQKPSPRPAPEQPSRPAPLLRMGWKDLRAHERPQDVLHRATEKLGNSVGVFAEACAPASGLDFLDRTAVSNKPHLVIWQYPPSAALFQQIVNRAGATQIYLIGADRTDCDEPAGFLRRLHGIVRYAVNKREGQVEGEKLSATMGATKMSIALGLTILRKVNLIDWFSQDGLIYLELLGAPTQEAEDLPEYKQLLQSLNASKEFRSWCASSRLEDIQLAVVPNHLGAGKDVEQDSLISSETAARMEESDEHPTEGD